MNGDQWELLGNPQVTAGSSVTGEQFTELFGLFILASWFQGHVEVCEANNVWAELVTFKEKVPHVLLKYGTYKCMHLFKKLRNALGSNIYLCTVPT